MFFVPCPKLLLSQIERSEPDKSAKFNQLDQDIESKGVIDLDALINDNPYYTYGVTPVLPQNHAINVGRQTPRSFLDLHTGHIPSRGHLGFPNSHFPAHVNPGAFPPVMQYPTVLSQVTDRVEGNRFAVTYFNM